MAAWLLLVLTSLPLLQGGHQPPRVTIKGGQVQGSSLTTVKGNRIFAFKGIPYGEPPVGHKRFQPPEPRSVWQEVLQADKDGPNCPQMDFERGGIYTGQEDCLFLNVYVPQFEGLEGGRPVMVFFHGGAFSYGSGSSVTHGPGRLMDYDIVLVTVNYRLGVLGFLNVNDQSAPGNVGLLDQVLALQWVQQNIKAFGGDPGRVTIFGHSAGAASATYHLLSPLSKGLFHQVIAQSGSALCRWALRDQPEMWAQKFAKDLGCPTEPPTSLVSCLQEKPARKLVTHVAKYYDFLVWPMPFLPSVQKVDEHNFLSATPMDILRSGKVNKVPIIVGWVKDEGLALYLPLLHLGGLSKESIVDTANRMVSAAFDLKGNSASIVDDVQREYFGHLDMEDLSQSRNAVIEIISDAMNKACGLRTAELLTSSGFETYAYSMEHQLNRSITQRLFKFKENLGVAHGDDLVLLFDGPSLGSDTFPPEDEEVSNVLLKLWTQFAGDGVPARNNVPVQWNPMTQTDRNCLNITTKPEQIQIMETDRLRLWNDRVHQLDRPKPIRSEL